MFRPLFCESRKRALLLLVTELLEILVPAPDAGVIAV